MSGVVTKLHVALRIRASQCSVYFLTASPVDHSRVILRGRDPNIPGSDYINANYIKVRLSKDGCMPKLGEGLLLLQPSDLPLSALRTTWSAQMSAPRPTLPARAAWTPQSMTSGKWYGRRTHALL